MKNILIILLIMGFFPFAFAQTSSIDKVGTAGYQFLKIRQGARGVAMGDAFAPMAGDASAVFWDPARLNLVENSSLFFTHNNFLAGVRVDAFAFSKRIQNIGVLGVNMVYLNSGDIEETTVFQQNGTGRTYFVEEFAVGVSYARMLTQKFGVGLNFKYAREDLTKGLGLNTATQSWAVDVGTVYYPGFSRFKSLRMVMDIRNFAPEIQPSGTYIDYSEGQPLDEPSKYKVFPLPLTFEFGIGIDPVNTKNQKLSVAVVAVHPNDHTEQLNIGAEYTIFNTFSLRSGYILNHDSRTLSAGIGIKRKIFNDFSVAIDYAYADYGILNYIQVFSMVFEW